MQLSKNFTLYELINSETTRKYNIDNTPTDEIINNLTMLVKNTLQIIRDYYKKPVIITSGYRCPELNKAVGSKATSQHILGEAVDFIVKDKTIDEVIKVIPQIIDFDQLIKEKSGSKEWIHLSYRHNRRQILSINVR